MKLDMASEGSKTAVGRTQKQRNSPSTPRYRGHRRNNFVTKHEMRGGKIDVSTNPPEIAYQPWMPLIVVHSGKAGDIAITVRDLAKQIVSQVDPAKHALKPFKEGEHTWNNEEPTLQIRLRSIRAWNLTGRMISLSVDDFSSIDKAISDVDTLCGLVDTGSSLHVPAVGYQLPNSHQNIVLRNDSRNSGAILYHVMCAETDTCIIYTSIFYRFDGPAKFSAFQDSMMALVQNLTADVRKITTSQKKLVTLTKQVADHTKGDLGSAIIDGVKHVAPFVIPAAAMDVALHAKMDELASLVRSQGLDDVSVLSLTEAQEDE